MSGEKALISPSLLSKICIYRWIGPERFDLGPLVNNFLADDIEESVFAAAAEMPAVASGSQTCKFGEPVDDEYLDKLKRSAIPAKTRQQTKWAVLRWDTWALTRSLKCSKEPVPQLEGMTEKMIEFWFKRFVVEIRKKDGKCYPPDTLYQLVVSLQRYLREKGNFIDIFQEVRFADVKVTLDAEMKRLGSEGAGSVKKQADAITEGQEELLWSKGLLGAGTPQQPLDTLVYNKGLYFALRSGKEHRQLRANPCQITVVEPPGERAYLKYIEDISKNKQGGIKGRHRPKKEVVQHENTRCTDRCPVKLFKLYVSLCPKNRPPGALYLKSLSKPTENCWFSCMPLGHNELEKTIKRLCMQAGFEGHFTNHSLRRTTAT